MTGPEDAQSPEFIELFYDDCSAIPRRFSPDMKRRWMPTIYDRVLKPDDAIPFSGFATRREAIAAARQHKAKTTQRPYDMNCKFCKGTIYVPCSTLEKAQRCAIGQRDGIVEI